MGIIPPPGIEPINAIPGFFNLDRRFLGKWRKARALVSVGTGFAKVACVGDSTTGGTGADPAGSTYANGRYNAHPYRLAKRLSGTGLNAIFENVWGGSGRSLSDHLLYNPRITLGTGWSIPGGTGVRALGGPMFVTTTNDQILSFNPSVPVDRFVIWTPRNTTLAAGDCDIDGGTVTAINETGTAGFFSTTLTTTLGAHTVNIRRKSGTGSFYVAGIEAYNSAAPSVRIQNMGFGGSTAADWNLSGVQWNPLLSLPVYAPDLTFINLGINDRSLTSGSAVTDGTFTAAVQALITAAKASGDVVLVVPVPSSTSHATDVMQDMTRNILRSLAVSNGCVVADMTELFGTYNDANTAGLMFDVLHPNAWGYNAMADLLAELMLRA